MDLVYKLTSERSRISQEIDKGLITESQGNEIISGILREIAAEEKERQEGGR